MGYRTSVSSLISAGPLTTLWTPPASCLSTTSQFGYTYQGHFFIGWNSAYGPDWECFPSVQGRTIITSASYTTQTTQHVTIVTPNGSNPIPYPTIYSASTETWLVRNSDRMAATTTALYFSPGICPSGYIYAATFTDASYVVPYPFTATTPSNLKESRYMCCPDGFSVSSIMSTSTTTSSSYDYAHATSSVPTTTYFSTARYDYPICIQTASAFHNVWYINSEWPYSRPSSLALSDATATAGLNDMGHSTSHLTATASGFVVGWRASDAAVTEYLKASNIELPTVPTSRATYTDLSTATAADAQEAAVKEMVGGIVGGIVLVLLIPLVIVLLNRSAKKREAMKANLTADELEPSQAAFQLRNLPGSSTDVSRMDVANHGGDEEAPPKYQEAVRSPPAIS
ncbi:hypothetical protein BT63DRAFT_279480 [Microthyrium microscopicum]|uniref:Uncharacterized protein n=1 Tax=Microthyrium microscopicum TaxID=703497 RepID=A0A6A6U8D3_9PEZI|nr:hypothetical protein BT63DRAFT_279480 [Microthyrium microscopicum]